MHSPPLRGINEASQPAAQHAALLDGAIGAELQRRGATIDPVLWSATATLTHPDLLTAVHRDYIAAGSDIITANTFFSSKHNMIHAGRRSDFTAINSRAVNIARHVSDESCKRPLVAGSLSTMPPLNRASYVDKGSQTTHYFTEQIHIMEEEGADLLLLEMLLESDSARSLLEACASSRLPVWAGLSASLSDSSGRLIGFRRPGSYGELDEETFGDLCTVVADFQPDAIGVMHTRPELLDDALAIARGAYNGLAFTYPNVGHFQKPTWIFPDDREVEKLCGELAKLHEKYNLCAIGGCCGTTPNFIKLLGKSLVRQ